MQVAGLPVFQCQVRVTMKWGWVNAAIFLVFSLVACVEGQEVVVESTAVPTPPPTIEPTVMETAVVMSVVAETAVATDTLAPSPASSSPTPTFDWSLPTREPLPDVPLPDGEIAYDLTTPSSEKLFDALRQAAHAEDIYIDPTEPYKHRFNSDDFYHFVNADLDQFYPDNIPHVAPLLEDVFLSPYYFGYWIPSQVHLRILEESFIQNLNEAQPNFVSGSEIKEETYRLLPTALQVHDGHSLWVLQLDSHIFRTRLFVLVERDEEGGWNQIGEPLSIMTGRYSSEGWTTIYTEHDVTGDEIPEVILESWTYWSGTGYTALIEVFSWDGEDLVPLPWIEEFDPEIEIADYTGDEVDDIRVTRHYSRRFGCEWEEVDVYSWNGLQAEHIEQDDTPPDTAVCNLSQAVSPFYSPGNLEKDDQYPLLERAVTQMREDDSASPDLVAYAETQLAMAYAEQNRYEESRAIINTIYESPEQSEYIQYIQKNNVTGSVVDLCRNLVADAESVLETNMGEYLNMYATHGPGSDSNEPDKRMICDLKYLAFTRLQNVSLPSSQPPQESLAALDFQLAFHQSANFDNDFDLEWVGVLEPEAPWLVIFDAVDEQWQVIFIKDLFYTPILDLSFEQLELTEDETLDLVIAIRAENYSDYPEPTILDIILVENVVNEFTQVASFTSYEAVNLSELTQSHFGLGQPVKPDPFWVQLEDLDVDADYLTDYLEELQTAVLTQTDPTVPEKITQLLNYLPTDDLEAQPYIEHLTYLLGYFYELSGDGETAVSTYLDLIQRYPTSPWSWLAWARLEPVR
ncbi:MAG: hypothetical protein IPM53_18785 [Anaerolineaceae bacterium]|nr:hypothetical protein [Anaerolineaceae bacterium]